MSKKARIVGAVISLALTLGIIAYYIIKEVQEKRHQEQTEAAAVSYISEKYGFEAEVLPYNEEAGRFFFQDYRAVKLSANGREFFALVNIDVPGAIFYDNYQFKEIEKAAVGYVCESLPGGMAVNIWLCERNTYDYAFYNKLFDGENIEELLCNSRGSMEMVFADTELSADTDIVSRLSEWGLYVHFTSFDTAARAEEFIQRREVIQENDYQLFAPYITDSIQISSKGEESLISYELTSYADFCYCYFPTVSNKYKDSSADIEVSAIPSSTLTNFFGKYEEQEWLSKPITNAYQFDDLYGDVCIYYPLSQLTEYDISKLGAAWCTNDTGILNNRDIARAEICGEYAVFTLPLSDQQFMLVDNSGQAEYIAGWKKKKNKE